ncbi:MAG: DUF11 domain-containing protein [Sedimentisphaerales bacterium]|nr:DUF11 domain-containing protein [Sedimentisphaerales bacterium]
MKKVWIVSFLVFLALVSGCKTADRAQSPLEQSRSSRAGRSYFWDKDLRPAIAVPGTAAARTEPAVQPVQTPPERQSTSPVISEPVRPVTTRSELVTASVEQLSPVQPHYVTPAATYENKPALGPGLVAVSEAGGHILSITYPRPEFGMLQVDKTMPEEVRIDTPFAYVIKVTNLTEVMLTDVVITETVSNNFQFQGSDPTAVTEGNKLVWEIDSLGPRASKSIRISGVATGPRQLEHCTAVTHTVRDCSIVKVVEPSLELAKMAPTEALLCEPIAVDFVVTNTGTGTAENVQIVDTLPSGMQTVDGKGKIVLDAGTLASGESRRFSIKLRATRTGAYINKAIATSASGLKAESEATLTTVRQPTLVLTKSGPQRQFLGRSLTYEITVVNKGDGPARDTVVEDMIPPGVTSVEATSGAQFSGSKLIWQLGTLEPNVSKTVRVSYMPTKEGDVMATATATAYCAETVTASAKTSISGIAAARLEVVDLEDPVEVGNTTTYLITVTNQGSAADTNLRIVCALDDNLQYVSSAGATAGSIMGKTVSFAPLRSLEPKAKATWRVVVRGARAGDVRLKVTMHTDQLALPVEHTEVTHIYQQ